MRQLCVVVTALFFSLVSAVAAERPSKIARSDAGCTTPPPTVTSITPTAGIATGNTAVTINGANFVAGSTVKIGGLDATSVSFVSTTQLTAQTPTGLTAGTTNDVVVTTPSLLSGTLSQGFMADFLDVPSTHQYHDFVEKIFRHSITAGCGGGNYCPDANVRRDQMAVFILSAEHGPAYRPPAATGTMFNDVPANAFAAAWIEQFAREGITAGCSSNPPLYCPASSAIHSQMAVFLLRAKWQGVYQPAPATGLVFADVSTATFAASWIEELWREAIWQPGIYQACPPGAPLPKYCPDNATTRGEMAPLLVHTFNLS
jgi:hypothetical protein